MPTPLLNLAQDLNRSLLHGARRVNKDGKTVASTVIDGRQATASTALIEAGVEILPEGGSPATGLTPLAGSVSSAAQAATTALEAPESFFQLAGDQQIPTWIYHRKLFSLPDRPLVEDGVELDAGSKKLLRLPAAILHEAEKHRATPDKDAPPAPAALSLCRVKTETTASNASYQTLEPLDRVQWQPALLLRCPLNPAWDPSDAGAAPVFELEGIPQSQRWYLDRLGLMETPPRTPVTNKDLRLWIELPRAEGDSAPATREEIGKWVIARRHLTGLARPGQVSDIVAAASQVLPYTATHETPENTLRLLQMASITNAGGYYLRAHDKNAFAAQKHTLVIALLLRGVDSPEEANARMLPFAANAVIFPANPKTPPGEEPKNSVEPTVVRFEGRQHVIVEPYAPPGCLAFGWRRPLPALANGDDNHPGTPEGFARSIHLLDYEVYRNSGAGPQLCQEWQERIIWKNGTRCSDWQPESCSGDLGPALSPVQPLAGQSEDNTPLLTLPLDAPPAAPAPHAGANPPPDSHHFYRCTIRFAQEKEGFDYLANPASRTFLISAGFRDIFGNRLLSGLAQQKRGLFYTDAVVAPAEWPGFVFRLHPLAGGMVSLHCHYRPPETASSDPGKLSLDPVDAIRKLVRVRAQVNGAANDFKITVEIPQEDGQQDLAPAFSFIPEHGADALRDGLLAILTNAIEGKIPAPLDIPFKVESKLGLRPVLFTPQLVLRRTDAELTPKEESLPGDQWLRKAVNHQVFTAMSPLPLARDGTEPAEGTAPPFIEIARAFAEHFEAPFSTQTALRRNRFNEHELWFVPNLVFPVAGPAEPVFASPRPLNNILGADTFLVPSFTPRGDTSDGTWNQFDLPLYSTSVSGIDYDLLGRRVFSLLEELSQPAAVTGTAVEGNDPALWNSILAAKDAIAGTLGTSDKNFVVAVDTQIPPAGPGITRMCKDAFQRDLRLYYGVDTLVQWPLNFPAGVTGITNYYGRSAAVFNRTSPPLPKYSDFVLNLAEDASPGLLTVTHDLPPGDESTTEWRTKSFHASLTHIQLSAGPDDDQHPFNPGQWLELVRAKEDPDTSIPSVARLDYVSGPGISVPAADRRFPKEPILTAALAVPSLPGAVADPVDWLGKWGWQVVFAAEGGLADNLFLEVEYDLPEETVRQPGANADAVDDWRPVSLLHALVVLDSLASQPAPWWASDEGRRAKTTLPILLTSLNSHLQPKFADALSMPAAADHFVIPLKTASGTPIDGKDPGQRVKQIVPKVAAAGAMKSYTIDAAPGFPLNLAAAPRTRNFRPSLKLRRNDQLAGGNTNPLLIYECGPVIFHSVVRAANRWREALPVQLHALASLTDVLERTLGEIFGRNADLSQLSIRLDCRHAFKAGIVRLENPFVIFPTDFTHSSPRGTAELVVQSYREWLGGGDPAPRLADMKEPELIVGLQVAEAGNSRTLLEVGSLCFPLAGLTV